MEEEQQQEGNITPRRTARDTTQREELRVFIASAQKPKKTPVKSEPRSVRRLRPEDSENDAGPSRLPGAGEHGDGSPSKAGIEERRLDLVHGGEPKMLRARKMVNYMEIPPEPMNIETEVVQLRVEGNAAGGSVPDGSKKPRQPRAAGSTAPKRSRVVKPKPSSKVKSDGTAPRRAPDGPKGRRNPEHTDKEQAACNAAGAPGDGADGQSAAGNVRGTTLVGDGAIEGAAGSSRASNPVGAPDTPESTPPTTLRGQLPDISSPTLRATQSSRPAKGKRKALELEGGEATFRAFQVAWPQTRSSQPSASTTPLQSSGEASAAAVVGPPQKVPRSTLLPRDPAQTLSRMQAKSMPLPGRTVSQELAYQVESYSASLGYQPRHPLPPRSATPGSGSVPRAEVPTTSSDPPSSSQSLPPPDRQSHTRAQSDLGSIPSHTSWSFPSHSGPSHPTSNPMRGALSALPLSDPSSLLFPSSRLPPSTSGPVWLAPYELLAQFVDQQQQSLATLSTFAADWAANLQPTAAKWQDLLQERQGMIAQIQALKQDEADRRAFTGHQESIIAGLNAQLRSTEEERDALKRQTDDMEDLREKMAKAVQSRSTAEGERDEQMKIAEKSARDLDKANTIIVEWMKARDIALDQVGVAEGERKAAAKERDELRAEMERLKNGQM